MCGIAGHFSTDGTASRLDLACLRHRGPDASGEWRSDDGHLWLGHTRLSILDLSPRGAQPMADPATGNVIVFNGEIYNHLEIRSALTARGVTFAGTSDTETILMGYALWGEHLIPRLKGMFAFALYDASDGSLLLARDRFGIKPLYFVRDARGLRFASETRILRQTVALPVDRTGLAGYLQWGCSPNSRLLFSGLEEFPAGSWQVFRRSARPGAAPVRYWPPHPVIPEDRSPATRIRSLLENAVRQHLLSDVPVACLLSGGIDSSIVTALAARHSPGRIHTFSVGFPGSRIDESVYALQMARSVGCEHHHIVLRPEEVLQDVQDAVRSMDLPSVDAVNTFIVTRRVAQAGFKVALSGLGGDELFGGYNQFRMIPRFKWLSLMPKPVRSLTIGLGKGGHLLRDLPKRADAGDFDLWWRRIWHGGMLAEVGLPELEVRATNPPLLQDDFARISWSELQNYMRDMLLRDADQMTMAHSLELRVPFLDHELAEYVLGLPASAKTGTGPKPLLVASCLDLLPAEIQTRPKMGFELPMDAWMRGPLHDFVHQGVEHAKATGLFREEGIDAIEAAFGNQRLHWSKLWSLVVLGHHLARDAERIDSTGLKAA